MLDSAVYEHKVLQCQLIETHISWVILTGNFVYKIKKPVNFGFLDFSTLEKRHFYCEEELRLNRRLAPEIYLDVMEIKGTPENPSFTGTGDTIEYAVKMLQFPQEAQLDRALQKGNLQFEKIDAIADMMAVFHQQIDIADKNTSYGEPDQVLQPAMENFVQIREYLNDNINTALLSELECWFRSAAKELLPVLQQRKTSGHIRECHGDMHLGNLAWYIDKPLAFDCLEFNANLRWIDVMSEAAFLVMDLQSHQQDIFAQRFLNAYLEHSGDYEAIKVLRFYLIYRAMVRAKINAIRYGQGDVSQDEKQHAEHDYNRYLQLAKQYTRPTFPELIITRGLSASGKTTETQPLLELLPAIRIRSDVERKRLFGILSGENAGSNINQGIYKPAATKKTYARLIELAGLVIDAGYTVIIDAANLSHDQRSLFQNLASQKQVPYIILEFTASPATLRTRIMERKNDVSDADLTVLEQQLDRWQPLSEDEHAYAITIDTEVEYAVTALIKRIRSISGNQVLV